MEPNYDRLWLIVNQFITEEDQQHFVRTVPGMFVTGRSMLQFKELLNRGHRDALVLMGNGPRALLAVIDPKIPSMFKALRLMRKKSKREAAEMFAKVNTLNIREIDAIRVDGSFGDYRILDQTFLHVETNAGSLSLWVDPSKRTREEITATANEFMAFKG